MLDLLKKICYNKYIIKKERGAEYGKQGNKERQF